MSLKLLKVYFSSSQEAVLIFVSNETPNRWNRVFNCVLQLQTKFSMSFINRPLMSDKIFKSTQIMTIVYTNRPMTRTKILKFISFHLQMCRCRQQMTRKRSKTFYFISFSFSFIKFIFHLMLNDTIQNTHNLIYTKCIS